MDKTVDDPTYEVFKAEEEKFNGMCLIKESYMLRYGPLLKELHNAYYVSRDEYLTF